MSVFVLTRGGFVVDASEGTDGGRVDAVRRAVTRGSEEGDEVVPT